MSYYTYRGLLSKIGRQLSLHDHQQLLETCGLDDEANNIPDARSLLKRLEGKNHLGIDRLGVLKVVLRNFKEFTMLGELMEFEEERKECKNFLPKISDALDSDERNHLEQLKDICRRRQTSLELDESISNIRTLFEELEKHESLDFYALDFLKEILTEIKKEDLVKEIEEYDQRRNKNDRAEIRKAKFYSMGKVVTDKVAEVPLKTWIEISRKLLPWHSILSCFESVSQCFRSLEKQVLPPDTELADMGGGCVCFTVQASNLKGLTTLWKMYQDGTLKARLYDFLVTEVRHLAEAEENVELTVTIEEEEYRRAFVYLNNEAKGPAKVPGRKCEDSDSVISTTPNEDETLQVKVKRLENDVQLLKERLENQEIQTARHPLEFLETRMGTEIIPAEEVQIASYERLGDKLRGTDERKRNWTKMYVEGLQFGAKSLTSDVTDSESGIGTEGTPSEFDVDIGDKRDTQTVAGDDWNSLSSAVQTGNFAIIENMLSRGLDINTKNNDGNTALILAVSSGKIDAVNYLLEKGADPFIVGHSGITPLHAASKDDNVNIIETLMSRGLEIDIKDNRGATPLMLAAAFGKIEAVNYLLDNGADPCIRDQLRRNSLHAASEGGNVTIIETLMSRGLEIDIKDNSGDTPLMLAALSGKIEAVNYLLDNGADPCIRDQLGRNSLHTASQGGNVTIIETLMSRGLEIDIKDNRGDTPLMLAAACGKIEAVNYLLDKGADPCIRNQLGRNSLHAASWGGNVAIIETLMSRGLDVDSKDSGGMTPLMLAAAYGEIEAVNYLLDKGADPCIRDQLGRNSLYIASARSGNVTIIETLMSRGLEIDIKDNRGDTPLMLAALSGTIEAANYLLDNGADPCIRDHLGRNSLHAASQGGNVTIIETLMSRGLEIDIKDNRGATPLMLAVLSGTIEAVNYLLDNGADPCIRDQLGRNSLHAASQGGNVAIIETLMSRGLDVDSKDSGGRTPLMWAAAYGKIEAVKYLLDKGADPYIRDQSGRNLLHAPSTGGNVAIIKKMLLLGLDVNKILEVTHR